MTSAFHIARSSCTLELSPDARTVEFVAFGSKSPVIASDWPRKPGAVKRAADGWPSILHFAPARWLLPNPDPEQTALIAAASAAGVGSAIDVTGKWKAMTLRGTDAARLLSATIDVGALLESRSCAAVELFDCPALLTSAELSFRIYLRFSYVAAFCAACESLGASLASKSAT